MQSRETLSAGAASANATVNEPLTIALRALAATLADKRRAYRLLDLTGLDPGALRARAADPQVLGAVLDFLAGHEPDLLDVAETLELPPHAILVAGEQLRQGISE